MTEKTYRVVSEQSGRVWYQGNDLEKARNIAQAVSKNIVAQADMLVTEVTRVEETKQGPHP